MTTDTGLTLADVNAMDGPGFLKAFGGVFEHSPWIAEAAWPHAPFKDVDALHAAMMGAVRSAPRSRQLAFLRLHPELAGVEAQSGTMTEHSTREQAGAGLSRMTATEVERLRRMNSVYLARHGFPFIIAVLANSKQQIFEALETRTAAGTEEEMAAALAQISIITRRRLAGVVR